MPRMYVGCDTDRGELEKRVDKRRDRGTLCQHQHDAEHDQCDYDRRQPELLVVPHELPEFADDLYLRHQSSSIHLFIVAHVSLSFRIGLPVRIAAVGATT